MILHADTVGSGDPPLVALSSLGTDGSMWGPALGPIDDRAVVRLDTRGHGRSGVPPGPYSLGELGGDVLDTLDAHGFERVDVVGLSLGGMIAMWLAAHAPERVGRLVLVCTSAHLPPAEGWLARAAAVRAHGMAAVADAVVDRWFSAEADPAVVASWRAAVAAVPAEGYAGCCEAIAGTDLRADLPRIAAPTLLIAGALDPATPPPHLEAIAAGLPGARLALVYAAHLAAVERPADVRALVLDHLGGAR